MDRSPYSNDGNSNRAKHIDIMNVSATRSFHIQVSQMSVTEGTVPVIRSFTLVTMETVNE